MTTKRADSWDVMEGRLVHHLCTALGDEEGVDAFRLEDRPRAIRYVDDDATEWCLVLSGGAVENPRQSRQAMTQGMWEMDGEISVRGTNARCVRRKAAEILGALPIDGNDVRGLARCWAVRYPEIERLLEPTGAMGSAGEEIIVFYARIDIRAVFANVEED